MNEFSTRQWVVLVGYQCILWFSPPRLLLKAPGSTAQNRRHHKPPISSRTHISYTSTSSVHARGSRRPNVLWVPSTSHLLSLNILDLFGFQGRPTFTTTETKVNHGLVPQVPIAHHGVPSPSCHEREGRFQSSPLWYVFNPIASLTHPFVRIRPVYITLAQHRVTQTCLFPLLLSRP